MTTTVLTTPGPSTTISEPATGQTVVTQAVTRTVVSAAAQPGLTGPPGAAGSAVTRTAVGALSGHRVVTSVDESSVRYATNTDLADAAKPLWLTAGAAAAGDQVTLLAFGEVTEPSWAWTPGHPIFLGANGVLTQTPPTFAGGAAFLQQVAAAETATVLYFDPRTPIALT